MRRAMWVGQITPRSISDGSAHSQHFPCAPRRSDLSQAAARILVIVSSEIHQRDEEKGPVRLPQTSTAPVSSAMSGAPHGLRRQSFEIDSAMVRVVQSERENGSIRSGRPVESKQKQIEVNRRWPIILLSHGGQGRPCTVAVTSAQSSYSQVTPESSGNQPRALSQPIHELLEGRFASVVSSNSLVPRVSRLSSF